MYPPPATGYRERRYTAQDGLSLYFRDYGDALSTVRPVLCLGGLTRNSKDFHDFATRLAGRRRVVCPDYRGRGRSDYDPDWRHYRSEVYAGDLFHLLAAANLHGVVICGISLGGLLAMGLAVLAPALIAGVILNDVGPEVDQAGLSRILDYVGHDHPQADLKTAAAYLRKLQPGLQLGGEEAWRAFAAATFREAADGLLHVDWDVRLARALDHDVPDLWPYYGALKPLPDLWPYYGALKPLPVLALRGARSDVLTAETFERMAAAKPDLIRVTVPGVGHVPSLGHPQVERAIDDFLSEIDLRA